MEKGSEEKLPPWLVGHHQPLKKMETKFFDYTDPHNLFWQLIEEAQGNRAHFYKLIEPFSFEELRAFQDEFFRVKFWTDAHKAVMEKYDPKGSATDIRLYIISQGYQYYQTILQNPDELPLGITSQHPNILYYTIARVIESKYKDRFFNYKDPRNRFWQLIGKAHGSKERFYGLIEFMTYDELYQYKKEFIKAKYAFRIKDYLEVIERYNVQNVFDKLRYHIISHGYDYYQEVLQNPERLPIDIDENNLNVLFDVIGQVMCDKYADKLFDHTNPNNRFWKYIEDSQSNKANFYEIVSELSFEELQDYEEEFEKVARNLWTSAHYDAMGDITSEDRFDDTRRYVVGQGYDYYMDILQNPHKLPQGIRDGNPKLIYGAILRVMIDKYEDY